MSNPDAEQELLEVGADALRERGLGGLAERLRYHSGNGMPPGWVEVHDRSRMSEGGPYRPIKIRADMIAAVQLEGHPQDYPERWLISLSTGSTIRVGRFDMERIEQAIWEAFGRGG